MEPSGWELHKENIQPLSSGRNISLLKDSLDTSKSTIDHEAQIQELEQKIKSYKGDDPIEPHINLLHFLENQCLQSKSSKGKLHSSRMTCFRAFLHNSAYSNDKRFIDVLLKCLADVVADPIDRLSIIQGQLNKSKIGTNVALMYTAIADLQESIGKTQDALQTLKSGLKANAQPIQKLEEAHSQLEFRMMEEVANSFKGKQNVQTDKRNFGASVPIFGAMNDAPVFRNDLQPAVPVSDVRTTLKKNPQVPVSKTVTVFNENENDERVAQPVTVTSTSTTSSVKIPPQLDIRPKVNKENQLKPSRWNKPELTIGTDSEGSRVYDAPREKLTLFTDDAPVISIQRVDSTNGILKERKEVPSTGTSEILLETTSETTQVQPQSQSTSRNSSSDNKSVKFVPTDLQEIVLQPMEKYIIPNAQLMVKRVNLPSHNEASAQHLMRQRWLRQQKEKEQVEKLLTENATLSNTLYKLEIKFSEATLRETSWREKFDVSLKRLKELEAVERGLRSENENITHAYEDRILQLKEESDQKIEELQTLVEKLQDKLAQMSTGGSTETSNSNSSASILVRPERSHVNVVTDTDKLLDGSVQSPEGYFQAPNMSMTMGIPSSGNRELTFNDSVRMAGTTTVYGWRDDQTKFNFDDSPPRTDKADSLVSQRIAKFNLDVSPPRTDREDSLASQKMGMPPPLPVSRKIGFTLYESHLDSQSLSSKSRRNEKSLKQNPSEFNFKSLSENVAPLPPPIPSESPSVPIAAAIISTTTTPGINTAHNFKRKHEFMAPAAVVGANVAVNNVNRPNSEKIDVIPNIRESFEKGGNTIGQTFPLPLSRRYRPSIRFSTNANMNDSGSSESEPGFEPYVPAPGQQKFGDDLDFDISNLTCALAFGPEPLLNSTPTRNSNASSVPISQEPISAGNYIHTQRLPPFPRDRMEEVDIQERTYDVRSGQREESGSPPEVPQRQRENEWFRNRDFGGRSHNRFGFTTQRLDDSDGEDQQQLNLSPIQETSKENRSGCTTSTSSSSSSRSHSSTRGGITVSGTNSMFHSNSRSVSGDFRSANRNGLNSRYQ